MKNKEIPIVVVIDDNILDYTIVCKDAKDLEEKFKNVAVLKGHQVYVNHLEDGYIEFNNGSACMTWISK